MVPVTTNQNIVENHHLQILHVFFLWLVLVLELNIGYAFFQCTGESSAKKAMFGHVHNQLLGVQLRQMSFTMVNPCWDCNPPPVIHNL